MNDPEKLVKAFRRKYSGRATKQCNQIRREIGVLSARVIGDFARHFNRECHHEFVVNVTLADMCCGRYHQIIDQRDIIGRHEHPMSLARGNLGIRRIGTVAAWCLFVFSQPACTILDKEYVSKTEVPLILGPKPTPSSRWRNTCVVETEQQLRSIGRESVIHYFWYQTPSFDAPLFPPNLTHAGLLDHGSLPYSGHRETSC